MEEQLLIVSEVSGWLRMTPATIQRMAREGKLPSVKVGGKYRFRKGELEDWLYGQKNGNGQSP